MGSYIRTINQSGKLVAELQCERVLPQLSRLGLDKSVEILTSLVSGDRPVQDPTAFVLAASCRASISHSPHPSYAQSSRNRDQQSVPWELRKKIYELNNAGNLRSQLKYDQVSPVLATLEVQVGLGILQNLEDNAVNVADPTGYVLSAGRREAAGQSPLTDRSFNAAVDDEFDTKLRKRVGWLNNNCQFNSPLMYREVAPVLMRVGSRQAMSILKELEVNAASIDDPSTWVIEQARTF